MLHYSGKKNSILAMLMFIAFPFMGQITSHQDKKLLSDTDKAFEIGDYLNAMKSYEKLFPLDSTNSDLNYKLGVCRFELRKYKRVSKNNFEKANKTDYPEANYYLGLLNHSLKNYDKAVFYFNQYKNSNGDLEHPFKEINDLMEKCNTARFFDSHINLSVQIENLGKTINTEFPEYAPLIPADEKFLMFTSRRKNNIWTQTDAYGDYYEDIYTSEKKEKNWQPPAMLDTTINTAVHDACTGLSANGEKLLLYRTSKDLLSGDIYESNFLQGKWSNPMMLGSNVNSSNYLESSACYSSDNDIIFFSSNRPGGFGGKDLYLVRKLDNGKWGTPFNLGPKINTEYNEDAPYIDPSGTMLFFSSEGHKNMGGYDVFKSSFSEDGKFTEPENLGAPINTVNDDIFFVLNTDGSLGYMSSEREGGYGSQDIYSVYFPENISEIKAYNVHALDNENKAIDKVEIILNDKEKMETKGIYKSNLQTGKVLILINPKKKYSVTIQAKGFEIITLDDYTFGNESDINFTLKKSEQ